MTSAAENTGGHSVIAGKLLKGALGLVFTAPCKQRAALSASGQALRQSCAREPSAWMLQLPFGEAATAQSGCGRPLPGECGCRGAPSPPETGGGRRSGGAGRPPTPPAGGRPAPLRPCGRGAGAARHRGTGRRQPGEAGTHTHTHTQPAWHPRAAFTAGLRVLGRFVAFPDDARLPAGQRILGAALCSLRAAWLVPAAPGDGDGEGAARRAVLPGWGVPVGSLQKSFGRAGVCFWRGWLGGDRRCPSVLLRAWAGGMPGLLFALDRPPGGERMQFWGVKSPVNVTKEDGEMDLCPASRRAGWNQALRQR